MLNPWNQLQMIDRILDQMTKAKEKGIKLVAFRADVGEESKNQFCLFLKPGVVEAHPADNFSRILDLVLEKIAFFHLHIEEVHVLPWQYLRDYRIMNQHYGVLDGIARNASACMSDQVRRRFREVYGADTNEVRVLGGFEFLDQFEEISPEALDVIWANAEHKRLASGCFCAKIKVGHKVIFLMNGFTPQQLNTYLDPKIAIVVFMLCGDASWRDLRINFAGKSDPSEAAPGSLRHDLFLNQEVLGIRELKLATNGAHLSAGPVEALVELRRFTSDFNFAGCRPLSDLQFGRKLSQRLRVDDIEHLLQNPFVQIAGQKESVFDLTEGMDESSALDVLTQDLHTTQQAEHSAIAI